jgi:hypothetical protein
MAENVNIIEPETEDPEWTKAVNMSADYRPKYPSLKFSDSDQKIIKIIEDKPHRVDWIKNGEAGTALLLVVEYDKVRYNLWLHATTLKLGLAKVWNNHNKDMKDVWVKVSTFLYNHKKYGKVRFYNVEEIEIIIDEQKEPLGDNNNPF